MKKLLILMLQAGLLLTACGGSSGSGGGGNYSYTPANTTKANTTTQPVNTSKTQSTPTKSEKQSVIDYLKDNGKYSGGSYGIIKISTVNSWYVTDYISYSLSDDNFTSSVMMQYISGSDSIENFGMVSFKWGSFKAGNFLAQTTYTISGKSYTNAFKFTVSFSSYPSFQITKYTVLQTGLSSSTSDDAEVCASCVGRAINNFVKSVKSMGATSNLW